MKKILLLLLLIPYIGTSQDKVTISGLVTDFEHKPIAGAEVALMDSHFNRIYKTVSDEEGYYALNDVNAGEYMAMYVLVMDQYPRSNAVPEEDMRLEFWAWNIIADRDLTINPRYHRLELYGTTAYQVYGGYSGFFVYFRPMSLHKVIASSKDNYLDKQKMEDQNIDLSVSPEYLEVSIYADEEPLRINSIQQVNEYVGDGVYMPAYIVQVDKPVKKGDRPYIIFRVTATNKEFGETGENIYFYRIPEFQR